MMEKIKECMIEQNTILICNKNTKTPTNNKI